MSGIDAEIDRLTAERARTFEELLVLCEQRAGRAAAWRAPSRPLIRQGNNHHGITDAIREVVASESGRLTSPEVADRLEGRIQTGRRDPRRAVLARVHELVREEELRRDTAGRLSLARR